LPSHCYGRRYSQVDLKIIVKNIDVTVYGSEGRCPPVIAEGKESVLLKAELNIWEIEKRKYILFTLWNSPLTAAHFDLEPTLVG
jgi:hypothetical protein